MKPFQYASATSPSSARELVAQDGRYLAGGIDLLGEMKEYIAEPKTVVNIKSLPGLDQLQSGDKSWTIGANVTIAQLEDHEELKNVFPAVHQAAAEVGSRQIRNVATLGGNLAQHSRCWYYRQRDVLCLKKHGDMCYARHGENKYHSVFSGNTCISPVVSNLAVALGALDATVVVQRGQDSVRMSIPELYARAWENPLAHHSLLPGDLVLRVELPVRAQRSAYQQISEKSSFDWALVSCAAAAKLDSGRMSNARVVLGAISNVPHQVDAANQFLEGKSLNAEVAGQAADLILRDAKPLEDNGYKIPMARALIQRVLLQLQA